MEDPIFSCFLPPDGRRGQVGGLNFGVIRKTIPNSLKVVKIAYFVGEVILTLSMLNE